MYLKQCFITTAMWFINLTQLDGFLYFLPDLNWLFVILVKEDWLIKVFLWLRLFIKLFISNIRKESVLINRVTHIETHAVKIRLLIIFTAMLHWFNQQKLFSASKNLTSWI